MSSRPFQIKNLRKALAPLLTSSILGFLSSCSSPTSGTITVIETGGYQQNHGPFDDNGNYVESWADKPPKRNYLTKEQYAQLSKRSKKRLNKPRVAPVPAPQPRYVAHTPKPTPTRSATRSTSASKPKISSRPKPRTKSVTVKPKARPPIVHKVKSGNTLYGLSRKYKVSIGSIQRANKLTSSHIGIGDRLIIPRK